MRNLLKLCFLIFLFGGCAYKETQKTSQPIDTWDFSKIPSIKTIKTKNTIKAYSAPLPIGKELYVIEQNRYLQGFVNQNNRYFVALAISKNNQTFSPLKPSVWILLSDLN